jgi:hypothetical protein
MEPYRTFSEDDAIRAAEAALSRLDKRAVSIGEAKVLSDGQRRSLILRAVAVGSDGAATPIIIKATRAANYDPSSPEIYHSGLAKEWAAGTLLARLSGDRSNHAVLLAADTAQGVLVFEDFGGELASLVHPLLHGSLADAEGALTAYAVALARLHVKTLGRQADHAEIVRSAFPSARISPLGHGWIEEVANKVLSLLGGAIPPGDLQLMQGRLERPGAWLSLVHGDPCPDNVLLAADGSVHLIDFEFATPGHALTDAAYWRMGFPTCWCAGQVPRAVGGRIDRTYRAILSEFIPEAADDDVFEEESAIIGATWLFGSLGHMLGQALSEDTDWGVATRRSRILYYLESSIEMTARADVLRQTRRLAAIWLDDLRRRWPSSQPLAPYPAFRR